MTREEYHDLLIQTSLDGKFPAVNPVNGDCVYRTQDDKRCAVGLLIPDEVYTPSFEGKVVSTLVNLGMVTESLLPLGMTWKELNDIQLSHDSHVASYNQWNHEKWVQDLEFIFSKGKHDQD